MNRYLLDTNIVSETIKPFPSARLVNWLSNQLDEELFISTITLAEIQRGIFTLPKGKKRNELNQWFSSVEGPASIFKGRILSFDNASATIWAQLMADGKKAGRPRNGFDMLIAAIAYANDCLIITNNEKDFSGLKVFNPIKKSIEL